MPQASFWPRLRSLRPTRLIQASTTASGCTKQTRISRSFFIFRGVPGFARSNRGPYLGLRVPRTDTAHDASSERALGRRSSMPWILRGLFLVARTKRGRELLFAGLLAALDVAQSRRARRLYGQIGGAL